MTRSNLGAVCSALIAYDQQHVGLVSDVNALDKHGQLAIDLAVIFRRHVIAICQDRGWTAQELVAALIDRGIAERWIVATGLGGVLDLALDGP